MPMALVIPIEYDLEAGQRRDAEFAQARALAQRQRRRLTAIIGLLCTCSFAVGYQLARREGRVPVLHQTIDQVRGRLPSPDAWDALASAYTRGGDPPYAEAAAAVAWMLRPDGSSQPPTPDTLARVVSLLERLQVREDEFVGRLAGVTERRGLFAAAAQLYALAGEIDGQDKQWRYGFGRVSIAVQLRDAPARFAVWKNAAHDYSKIQETGAAEECHALAALLDSSGASSPVPFDLLKVVDALKRHRLKSLDLIEALVDGAERRLRDDVARALLQFAQALEPGNRRWTARIGVLGLHKRLRAGSLDSSRWEAAAAAYEAAVDARAHGCRAIAFLLNPQHIRYQTHPPDPIDAVTFVRALDSRSDEWIGGLAAVAARRGRWHIAAALYDLAQRIDPNDREWPHRFTSLRPGPSLSGPASLDNWRQLGAALEAAGNETLARGAVAIVDLMSDVPLRKPEAVRWVETALTTFAVTDEAFIAGLGARAERLGHDATARALYDLASSRRNARN
jgi:tetratricopeptide (TPR) repeat protein